MTKCANCDNDAVYFAEFTSTYFCERDLPNFLRATAKLGGLALPRVVKPAPVVEAPKPSKKKEVEPVVEETPVEETTTEE